ncbi:MAG: hypothetical protein LC808_24350 [Actinobacteria bacterium]|nr:hypothetical protein [Actinomycetota bacterium]
MASHEHDHDDSDASRADEEEAAEPVTTGEPAFDGAGSGNASEDVLEPGDGAPGDGSAPLDLPGEPDTVEAVDVATNGAADPVAHHPSDPAVDAPVGPPTPEAVGAERRGPGDAGRRSGRPAGGGRPPARAGAGGPASRRQGPPRNRRRPPATRRATTSRPTAPPDAEEERATRRPANRRGMVILLSALSGLAVVLTIIAVNLGRSADRKAAAPVTTTATTRPAATLPDAAFTTFRDDRTGFSIRYPTTWERRIAPHGEVRLYVSNRGAYSALVRVQEFEQATTPENLGNLRAFTDGSVAGEGVQVLKVDPVTINGLIGYRYLYTFVDENSGIQGAHLHYFLFQGRKANSIVFQALPTEEFTKAEGIFDQMLDSFRSDPEPAATPAPSTEPTTPG